MELIFINAFNSIGENGIDWSKIFPAIISGVIAILISVGLFFAKNYIDKKIRIETNKKGQLDYLNKQRDDILKIAVTYPYLETKSFCDAWDRTIANDDEKYQRYSVYCNLVFNYLAGISDYCNYDLDTILKEHINICEWAILHKKNWESPLNDINENIESYDIKFVKLISECIRKNKC